MRLGVRAADYRGRLWLFSLAALAALAVDQGSKLIAAAVQPHLYTTNPSLHTTWWLPFIGPLVASVIPSTPLVLAAGIVMGGAAGNVLDHYAWPGGVPDFIGLPWSDGIYNLADFEIDLGVLAAILSIAFALVRSLNSKLRPADPSVSESKYRRRGS